MRKYPLFLLPLILWGCSTGSFFTKEDVRRQREYSSLEITLSDMSKKTTAFYGKQGVPPNFDEKEFIRILEKIYPDKGKVEQIRDGFRIRAHAINGYYSVVLCERETGNNLMQDFSCTLNKVDIRYWDKNIFTSCEYEGDWKMYCP